MKRKIQNPKPEADDMLEIGAVVAAVALPKIVRRSQEILNALPAGKVLSMASLLQRLEVRGQNSMNHPALKPYRIAMPGRRVYYGSKETIARANIPQRKGK